jgi:integrase
VPTEQVTLARVALRRLGVVGQGHERDRRPTEDELNRIIAFHDNNPGQMIPIGLIVNFAVATGMRQSEICSVTWSDIDLRTRLATIRNRKDPRRKLGNHQQIPLLDVTGFDAVALLEEQRRCEPISERTFPYNGRSVGSSLRRASRALDIKDLRFHDLRHEATSRLFEAGLDIPEVSLVTGHKDWKMLQRYLNLSPAQLLQRTVRQNRYGSPGRRSSGPTGLYS